MARFVLPFLTMLLASCGEQPASPGISSVEASEFMHAVDLGTVAEAYGNLANVAHTARVVVEETDESGRLLGSMHRVIRRRLTNGGFEDHEVEKTFTGAFTHENQGDVLGVLNPLPRILPEDPPYTNPRTMDRYAYEMRADTTVGGMRLRGVQATLRPAFVDEQPIRYARYYVNDSGEVVGVEVLRETSSPLFDERSHIRVWLQELEGRMIPAEAATLVRIDTPGAQPGMLRLVQTLRPDGA